LTKKGARCEKIVPWDVSAAIEEELHPQSDQGLIGQRNRRRQAEEEEAEKEEED
jgi:hypothetical protein